MPLPKTIRQTMQSQGYPQETIDTIIPFDPSTEDPKDIVHVIDQMDKHLTCEQCLAIMQHEGCCKSGKRLKDCKAYAKSVADKPLEEKLAGIATIENMGRPVLNADGTITTGIFWHDGTAYRCACPTVKKLKGKTLVSRTYCGCCAGHFLFHYQNILGVPLTLQSIDSSPLDTGGEKPCTFTFAFALRA